MKRWRLCQRYSLAHDWASSDQQGEVYSWKTSLIHSVDSLHLAKEIQKQAIKHDCSCDILVEVNIAGEASKFGTSRDEAISLVEEIAKLDHIHIKGLMTIAPFVDDPEDNRQYFRDIKQLSVDIAQKT